MLVKTHCNALGKRNPQSTNTNTTEDASVFIGVFFWSTSTNMTIDDTLIQPSRFSMKTRSMCQNSALDIGLLSNLRYLEERKTLFSGTNMLSRCNLIHRPRTMSNYHKKMRKRTFLLGRMKEWIICVDIPQWPIPLNDDVCIGKKDFRLEIKILRFTFRSKITAYDARHWDEVICCSPAIAVSCAVFQWQ